ncbi:MAG TPA: DnaA/Hda family protein [Bauldia sp.]|nr:DnaA/Hda family protein [Bauldia sp.]
MSGGREPAGTQLTLGFPHEPTTGRADFVTGRANAEALALIETMRDWPVRGVLLVGPEGSGKSHLASIFCEYPGAARIAARDVARDDADRVTAGGAVAVEDLHAGPIDEAALFHVLNLAMERDAKVLMTSRNGPGQLQFQLPDLLSRLRAMRLVTLGAPDDDLLRRVLAKLFADRQVEVDPGVIAYVATRMERSFAAANRLVAALDKAALAGGRGVTRRLAAEVLGEITDDAQGRLWPDQP